MQANNFFDKLCRNEYYTNSRLREDCLNLLFDYPYLAQHMHYEVFSGSRTSYGIFRAIRSMGKAGHEKMAHSPLWGEIVGVENPTFEEFALASLSGDSAARAVMCLVGTQGDLDYHWSYSYKVLEWRIENDIVL